MTNPDMNSRAHAPRAAPRILCIGIPVRDLTFRVSGVPGRGSKENASHVEEICGGNALNAAIQAGNLDAAKKAYATARVHYERAESSVEGFVLPGFAVDDNAGNLDYLIDMRESTPVDAKVGWKGFHATAPPMRRGS